MVGRMKVCVIFLISAVLLATASCGASKAQRTPPLTPVAVKPQAPQRDVLKEAGDATWQVVTAPARIVAPKKVENKEPETYEAPAAMFIRRGTMDDDAPASAPASTVPQPRP